MTTQGTSLRRLVALGFLACAAATPESPAQVVERDVSITGPRGNTVERQVRTERIGPVIDRQVTIRRPEGTYRRETEFLAPRGGGYGGPRFIERDVIVAGPAPLIAAPFFSFFVGAPPPPPVVFAAPPPVVYGPPIAPMPPPRPVGVDQTADAIGDLKSFHERTRREAAVTLGKLGDARALPPLIERLKHDHEKEVRMAAAWALGEIGDPRAVVPLEVAVQFEKRPDVKAVAIKALGRIPRDGAAIRQTSESKGNWTPATVGRATEPPASLDDVPPPDPTPAPPRSEPGSGFGYPR